jgi:hypothetical protein
MLQYLYKHSRKIKTKGKNMNIQELLHKEMSRKEFLRLIGVSLLAVGGISSLLKSFEHVGKTSQKTKGYGVSAYGR